MSDGEVIETTAIEKTGETRALARPSALPAANEWEAIRDQASVLARTELVPDVFRGKPDDIVVVFLMARDLNIKPMVALQEVHVINGRPGLSAKMMMALVQDNGHEIWVEGDRASATAYGKRKGSQREESYTFTIDDAKTAQLFGKRGQMWEKYPMAMLRARAISGLCRQTFAKELVGFGYTPEELVNEAIDVEYAMPPALPDKPSAPLPGVHAEWIERLLTEHDEATIKKAANGMVNREIKSLHDLNDMPMNLRVELARKLAGDPEPQPVDVPMDAETEEATLDDVSFLSS